MRKTGRATGVPNRLCRREEIPHPPRDFLSPPPHRRKKGQILEPDRSRANRTGHLDVLTIFPRNSINNLVLLCYSLRVEKYACHCRSQLTCLESTLAREITS